jgi:hypothetical protein
MLNIRKPRAIPLAFVIFALVLSTIQSVQGAHALGAVITNDGSSIAGWSGSVALLGSGGNPGAALGFSKNESIYRAYGSAGSDISGAVIQIDAYFTSTQDFIKIIWGENAACNSAGGLQVVLGPATNTGSGNGISGWGGIQGGVNCLYGASPDGTIAGLGASGSWSINTWYTIKVVFGSTSTSYYVNDVLIQTRATSLPTQNYIFIGADDRNGYGFTNGVLVDNISIGGSATTTYSYSSSPMAGSSVTLSATVTPSSSTGTVTFKDASNNTLCTIATLSSGIGSCNTWRPSTPATYSVRAIYNGDSTYLTSTSASSNIVVSTGANIITFPELATMTLGSTAPTPAATASSNLTVTYTSATAPVCTVIGSVITVLITGTCTINANQAGNGTYSAATQVVRSFEVSYVAQTISFDALIAATLGVSSAPLIRGSASSGLGVSYSSATPGVCVVSGSLISMLNAGTCTITASQAGDGTYSAAASVSQSFLISAKPDDGQKELMAILTLLPGLASISKNIGDLAVTGMTKCVRGKLVKRVKLGVKCPKNYRKVTGS